MVLPIGNGGGTQQDGRGSMDWPNDADGDVFRRLHAGGFEFEKEIEVDFNIDFEDWPPPRTFMTELAEAHPRAEISLEDDYVLMQLAARLTYHFVVDMQVKLTRMARPHGGHCDSCGVLWDPRDREN